MALDVANSMYYLPLPHTRGIAGLLEGFVRTLAWCLRPETE